MKNVMISQRTIQDLQYADASMQVHCTSATGDPAILDTLGPDRTVLIIEMSSFQGLKMYYGKVWRVTWFQWHVSHKRGFCYSWVGLEGFDCSAI